MTTDDRTASTSADEQPTENLGTTATAVLSAAADEQRPRSEYEQPRADQPGYEQPRYGQPRQEQQFSAAPPVAPYAAAPAPSNAFSLTSLILGVTSVFFGLTVVAPLAGLVFGILGLRREPAGRTLAIWGIVLNAVMLGLVALMVVALMFFGLLVPLIALATGTDYR